MPGQVNPVGPKREGRGGDLVTWETGESLSPESVGGNLKWEKDRSFGNPGMPRKERCRGSSPAQVKCEWTLEGPLRVPCPRWAGIAAIKGPELGGSGKAGRDPFSGCGPYHC